MQFLKNYRNSWHIVRIPIISIVISNYYLKIGAVCCTCGTCNKPYIGQTSRNIAIRYKEHIRYIRNNQPQSAYAEHILKNKHDYGKFENTMTLIKHITTPSKLIPYEQLIMQQVYNKQKLIIEQECYDHNQLYKLAKTVDNT